MSEVDAGGMPGPPIEANEAIEAVELTKMWSPTAGLRPVSLTVAAGEMVVVRGRSGSGKSTLLALLAGLCRPDGGSARVAGAAPTGDTPWAKVALVPQVLGMAVELSIRENIVDAAAGRPDEARLAGLLERLDVAPFAGRRLGEVSMGQQQRAAVARALVQVPTVLLVDEPTSFQDGRHADGVVAELHRSAAAGAAVLVATHDPIVVAAADRVLDLQAV
ncbi:MAG: ATP-binding cassette domain-containing protein [Ilumatobacteraceae bacterium]|nr:ATP-binding cassette domain-containing protein [Ilumatobacter sp.]MCO5329257.1 ATP-binding cassette domain-containing protein [Ilumatobacteraceae bacterium]